MRGKMEIRVGPTKRNSPTPAIAHQSFSDDNATSD